MSDYSIYPKAIDGYAQIQLAVDKQSPVNAESVNRLRSAIINIENTLGVAPHSSDTYGDFNTVDERLENSEAILDSIDLQYVTDRGNETTHSLEVQNGLAALPAYTFFQDVDTGMYRPGDNLLGLSTGGLERVRIDDAGFVGIGKMAPGERLDVAGNTNIDGNLFVGGDIHAVGNITFDAGTGGTIILGSGPEDEVDFNADIISNIIPDQDSMFDLGSTAQQWQDLHVDAVRSSGLLTIEATGILDIDAAGATIDTVGNMTLTSSAALSMEGSIVTVDSTVGALSLNAAGVLDMDGNSVSIDSAGPISIDATTVLGLDGSSVVIESTVGPTSVTAANGISLSATTGAIDIISDASSVNINSTLGAVAINATGNISATSSEGDVIIASTIGNVQIASETSDIELTSSNDIDIDAANNITIDSSTIAATATSSVAIVATTDLDLTGASVDIDGEAVTIDSSVGSIAIAATTDLDLTGASVDIDGEAVTIDSSVGSVAIAATTDLDLDATNDVYIDAVKNVEILASTGDAKLSAANTVKLENAAAFALLSAAGNVAISDSAEKTTNPAERLSVYSGNVEVRDSSESGAQVLAENQFSTHALWATVNDFDDTGGSAHYTLTSSPLVSSITQLQADMNTPGVGSRWYVFTYDVTMLVNFDGNASVTIGNSFAALPVELTLQNGSNTVYFKSAAAPTDFSIIVSTSGTVTQGEFQIDNVSLKEIQGGNVIVNGLVTGGGTTGLKVLSNGNVGIGTNVPDTDLHINGSGAGGGIKVDFGDVNITGDNKYLKLGEGSDLTLTHDGTDSLVNNQTGDLKIQNYKNGASGNILFQTRSGGATYHNDALCVEYTGRVGVGTTAPASMLDVGGSASFAITNTNQDINLGPAHYTVLVDTSALGSDRTITLPDPGVCSGRLYNIKKIDSDPFGVIITPSVGNIDGVASKTISIQWVSITVQSDGNNWYII